MSNKLEDIKKINRSLASLDNMSRAVVELSYKIKMKLAEGKINGLSAELLKDILILRDAQEKNLNEIHEQLSESMNVQDLYSMIS